MVLLPAAKRVAEHETTVGVTETVRTVRIEFSARVASGDVHLGKVAHASDLDIVRSLHKIRALEHYT